jgi:hypothetical protein
MSEPERSAASTTTTPSGDDPIAAREVAGARLPTQRHFGDEGAAFGNLVGEIRMLGRINFVQAAREHGNCT